MEEPRWTLDELAGRVETALTVDYHGQASGRVRAVPDRRAIRWYTTIGLIDRPVAHRGRTALYGRRHLLQLVAVKRLQARGLPLVAIQQELAGATDAELARVARLPEGVAADPVPTPVAATHAGDGLAGEGRGRTGSGTARVARSETAATRPPGSAAGRASPAAARSAALGPRPFANKAGRARFWGEQPAAAFTAAPGPDATTSAHPIDPTGSIDSSSQATTLQGLRLGDGATLLLEPGRELGAEDVRAILDAARPLLATLRVRGLGAGAWDPMLGERGPAAGASNLDLGSEDRRAGGNEPRREHP